MRYTAIKVTLRGVRRTPKESSKHLVSPSPRSIILGKKKNEKKKKNGKKITIAGCARDETELLGIFDSSIERLPLSRRSGRVLPPREELSTTTSRRGIILSGIFLPGASRRHRRRRYRGTVTIVGVKVTREKERVRGKERERAGAGRGRGKEAGGRREREREVE